MRRVLLVHQPTDGGVGRHVADLAAGLAARGHEVFLCGPRLPAGLPDSYRHARLDLQRAIAPRTDFAVLTAYAGIVRRIGPDVVHAHSSKAGAIARLGRLTHPRTPVIYTPHGYAFAGYFSRQLERSSYREIERLLAPLSSRVLCVCEAEARLARGVGAARRVRVVHNGIEPAPDGPVNARMARLAERGPVVCALTQLRPGKGIETLIDALPDVLARHPDAQVAIGGDGPDLQALRERARARGALDAMHFLGPCEDPLTVLRGSDLFVHPSWAESFPYAILEAMSVGLPIVASDVGGVGEAVYDGESGSLVPPGDAQALARALSELLGDTARGASLGEAARRTVEQRFTRTSMVDGIDRVYADAVAQRHPAEPGAR